MIEIVACSGYNFDLTLSSLFKKSDFGDHNTDLNRFADIHGKLNEFFQNDIDEFLTNTNNIFGETTSLKSLNISFKYMFVMRIGENL